MYLNNVLSSPNPLIQLWQLLIHVSTCFISQSSSPTKEISFHFFFLLFTKCWNIIFPRTEWEPGKRKWLFLFITFHFGQPDGAFFFLSLLSRLLNICCSLHLNASRTLEKLWNKTMVLTLCSLNSSASLLFITEWVFMSVLQQNNGKSLEIRYEARLFHLNKRVCVCHRKKLLILWL